MSNRTYNELWSDASERLAAQSDYEKVKESALAPKDRDSALQHLAILYVNYVQILKSVENAYDQVVHPQKRRLLMDLLLAVIGRLLEVKHKLVELQSSDIQHLSDILIDMKLAPEDMTVTIPRFYMEDRARDLEQRRLIMKIKELSTTMVQFPIATFGEPSASPSEPRRRRVEPKNESQACSILLTGKSGNITLCHNTMYIAKLEFMPSYLWPFYLHNPVTKFQLMSFPLVELIGTAAIFNGVERPAGITMVFE
ncbi:hypothetical protein SeLEV6574_g01445 [Synchytrium endobioticum]|uniref:Uncharacterized protein n=1 Tax=Synchytrium endobioticum TaxID=286115 RepID=A0A507DCW8_9FUNG|nr:hypothetical protein SeLEV6574_g01445 [Synchytrium endobioticum]